MSDFINVILISKIDVVKRRLKERKTKILNKPIPIWKNMTVTELSIALKEPVASVVNVISKTGFKPNGSDNIIRDHQIIKNVILHYGCTYKDITENKNVNNFIYNDCQLQYFLKWYGRLLISYK
jgi:hypothetical protein